MQPTHNSMMVTDFISWAIGHDPDLATIYASYSDRLGGKANAALQRIWDSPKFRAAFPELQIPVLSGSWAKPGAKKRTGNLIEIEDKDGFFRNTTVKGAITGEGLGLGVIDDPIKNREEASSIKMREKVWDWFTDDFFSRFTDDAALLGIMTRWHLDDPFGRLQAEDDSVKVLRYPAIAEHDERHRRAGEPLMPEHKPLDFILERKRLMTAANFEALYQQNPVQAGGEMFKEDWWQYYENPPQIQWRTIYADTAQKAKTQNDYSVFQCWGYADGKAVLLDQVRGKWEAPELLTQARAFWAKHRAIAGRGSLRAMKIEDKVSGTGLIQTLKRESIPVVAIQRNIDKVMRAGDALPFAENGNVLLPQEAPWLSDWLSEVTSFPAGAHDDQVDPMVDAIVDMLSARNEPRIRAL